jgi:iron complex outermembrane receptor protein
MKHLKFSKGKASWDGFGADSFSGNRPDSGKWNRYNLGLYLIWLMIPQILVNGTIRYEDYSDFGGRTVWKLSSRYKF